MDSLIKYGWSKNEFNSPYKKKFQKISLLMRIFKSRKFEYVSIDEYFIDGNNLYFIGNNEVYSIDLNDDFNSNPAIFEDLNDDYKKIKFVCKYTIDNIFRYELMSNQHKREKRLNELFQK